LASSSGSQVRCWLAPRLAPSSASLCLSIVQAPSCCPIRAIGSPCASELLFVLLSAPLRVLPESFVAALLLSTFVLLRRRAASSAPRFWPSVDFPFAPSACLLWAPPSWESVLFFPLGRIPGLIFRSLGLVLRLCVGSFCMVRAFLVRPQVWGVLYPVLSVFGP